MSAQSYLRPSGHESAIVWEPRDGWETTNSMATTEIQV